MCSFSKSTEKTLITSEMLDNLPPCVAKWLTKIGMVGKEKIQTVYLKQKGVMKLKPEQKKWIKAEAEQYITIDPPAFLWKANMAMFPLVSVTGQDLFKDGQGEMQIKIASFIPVASVKNNSRVNQSTLQRYLLEMPWYPSAVLSSYITWERIDEYSAKATMSYKGVSGSATFCFDKEGNLVKCSAHRYRDGSENAEVRECIGTVKKTSIINGIEISTHMDVSWVLDEGVFTWYKLEIFDVEYNKTTMPV